MSERWTGLQTTVPQRRKGSDLKTSKTDDTTTIPTKKPWPRTSILASQVVKKVRSLNLEYWKVYTSDKWILETVVEYQIEFTQTPFQNRIPREIPFPDDQTCLFSQEVDNLLRMGAIEIVPKFDDQFISTFFVVLKKDAPCRPVINLKFLNEYVQYYHLKQENLNFALDLIQPTDYLTKLDLKDAYFHVKIHKDYKTFLCFPWKGILYCFTVLPFGQASAPRVFTKLLRPISATFIQNGIRCCFYIDDSLMMNQDKLKCKSESLLVTQEMENLGFTINETKSVLIPTQRL